MSPLPSTLLHGWRRSRPFLGLQVWGKEEEEEEEEEEEG